VVAAMSSRSAVGALFIRASSRIGAKELATRAGLRGKRNRCCALLWQDQHQHTAH
jgi:hypothetical protein